MKGSRYILCAFLIGGILDVHAHASIKSECANQQLSFDVKGPREVSVGQDFEYRIYIKGFSCAEGTRILLYYYPPKGLDHISCKSAFPDKFGVWYSEDYNRVFAEGWATNEKEEVALQIRLRARPEAVFHEERDTASYFSFMVCTSDGDVSEYYQRKGLNVVAQEEDHES